MPNYEVATIPRIMPFWKSRQNDLNNYYHTLYVAGWDINNQMHVVIDDDKKILIEKFLLII